MAWSVSVLLLVMAVLHVFELDDGLTQALQAQLMPKHLREHSIWLPRYQLQEQIRLPGIAGNASDIVYVAQRGSYFVVVNNPPELYEYSEDFQLRGRHALQGFEDPEALAYDGRGNLLIGEERRQTVITLPLSALTGAIERNQLQVVSVAGPDERNRGLEGMAYDPDSGMLLASKEQHPMQLFEVTNIVRESADAAVKSSLRIAVADISIQRLNIDDISAMSYDVQSRHLLILSHESQLLVEVDSGYVPVSFMDLEHGFNGLSDSIPQAEGVTLGPNRDLLIVSEPNLLYRYRSTSD